MMRCIDVSAHQGHIDWPAVAASGIQATIIRAGYGNSVSQRDKQFVANITGAAAAGLKIGIYWFSYADSPEDSLKEWAACRQIIAPYRDKIKLPVAFDYEYDSVAYYRKIHGTAPSNALINQMTNAWLGAAKNDGWQTALYTNNDYRLHVFTAATLAAWDIWLADYSGGPDVPCAIQQTSSTGRVPGISGSVDMNTIFKDYAPALNFKSDTTQNVTLRCGQAYQFKITSDLPPKKVNHGTDGVATVLPRYSAGREHFYYVVAYGCLGAKTGIYVNEVKQFSVQIE